MADELSIRLATPIDQVVPGLSRLAETLNSPMMRSMPTDLGQFMEIINDLGRRMSPLTQMAEQAGSLFGLRLPGLGSRQSSPALAPAPARRSRARGQPGEAGAGQDDPPSQEGAGQEGAGEEAARPRRPRPRRPRSKKRAAAKRSA